MIVQVVKLTTGEEIIAELWTEPTNPNTPFVLNNAMLVAVQDGRLVFIPYMQYTDASKTVSIPKEHVMFVCTPVDSLISDYERAIEKVIEPRKSIMSSVP